MRTVPTSWLAKPEGALPRLGNTLPFRWENISSTAPGFQHDYFGAASAELLRHHPASGAGTDDAHVKDLTLAQLFLLTAKT